MIELMAREEYWFLLLTIDASRLSVKLQKVHTWNTGFNLSRCIVPSEIRR